MCDDNKFVWMPSSVFNEMPIMAVPVCKDPDGFDVYLGRASVNGKLYLAKVIPKRGEAYAQINGNEVWTNYYDVFCCQKIYWCDVQNSFDNNNTEIEKMASVELYKKGNQPIHIGRTNYFGCSWLGTVRNNLLCVTVYGTETETNNFEILLTDINDNACSSRSLEFLLENFCHIDDPTPNDDNWRTIDTTNVQEMADLPFNAIHAGRGDNDSPIFIGRAQYNGEMHPAVVSPIEDKAFIYIENEKVSVDNVEVLTGTHYGWVDFTGSHIPKGAVFLESDARDKCVYRKDYLLWPNNNSFKEEILVDIRKHTNWTLSDIESSDDEDATKLATASIAASTPSKKNEAESTNEKLTCKVCLHNPVEVILIPCYHSILCKSCCETVMAGDKKCSYCRKTVTDHHQLYY